jgi:replicative DNA helicase
MLMERGATLVAMEQLTGEMFYRGPYRAIWSALVHLHESGGAVDLISAVEELRRRGQLDEVGGPTYLTALVESCPSAANIAAYVKPVKDTFLQRQYLRACEEIKQDIFSGEHHTDEIIARTERRVLDIGRCRLTAEPHAADALVLDQRARIMEAVRNPGAVSGVLSGFPDLDRMTGGFKPSELITLAGASSMGKSALASQIASHALQSTCRPVVIFSLEMSREQWIDRMASAEARIKGDKLRNATMTQIEWIRLHDAQEEFMKLPLHIVDTPALTTMEIKAQTRRISSTHGIPALVVIDYLQIAEPAERVKEERLRVTQMVRDFKNLAREAACPVLCLSQLSRAVASRENKRPVLSDLRETSAIEAESDVVMFVYRPSYYAKKLPSGGYEPTDDAEFDEIIIGKQRNGPTGVVAVRFIAEFARFESAARENL